VMYLIFVQALRLEHVSCSGYVLKFWVLVAWCAK
jgi:hypothetical protein